jgi:hypothetical protein
MYIHLADVESNYMLLEFRSIFNTILEIRFYSFASSIRYPVTLMHTKLTHRTKFSGSI